MSVIKKKVFYLYSSYLYYLLSRPYADIKEKYSNVNYFTTRADKFTACTNNFDA